MCNSVTFNNMGKKHVKNTKNNTSDSGIIRTLSSLQFGLVLLITIVVVAVIGTLIPQERTFDFYQERYGAILHFLIRIFNIDNTYQSPLFLGLLVLFGLNLCLCSLVKFPALLKKTFLPDFIQNVEKIKRMPIIVSISGLSLGEFKEVFDKAGFPLHPVNDHRLYGQKGRIGYLGAFTVHLSLLIILIGGMISLLTSVRGHIVLRNGESVNTAMISQGRSFSLGFEISLDRFDVEFYRDYPERPKSYTSSVTVTLPDGHILEKDIRVNDPLMLNNLTVYQSSYGILDESSIESASDDTARVAVSLKGLPEAVPPIVILDMVTGKEFTVPGFGDSLKIMVNELHRNFKRAVSSSKENEPAVKIDVMVNGEIRWSVYAFKNFPGMNMPMHTDIPFIFSMFDIKQGMSDSGNREDSTYYTVLGVVKDRGIPVVWTGSMIMMLGLFLSFYVRPRRMWVLEENGNIVAGAEVKGDPESFRKFIEKTLKYSDITYKQRTR